MYYVVVKQSPRYHQITLEEYLGLAEYGEPEQNHTDESFTRTYEYKSIDDIPYRFVQKYDIQEIIRRLEQFNERYNNLFSVDRASLYSHFHIPKHSGGLRRIDAPNEDLKGALYDLQRVLENVPSTKSYIDGKLLYARCPDLRMYHTNAYAYIRKRSTIQCVRKHQRNESNWYCKLDLHNFFGATTQEFVMDMVTRVFPFTHVARTKRGRDALSKALSLCFLDGGLPQGTPISPFITNLMMIPFDFEISRTLHHYNLAEKKVVDGREYEWQRFVFTRYADDFIVSSRFDFNPREIEKAIVDELESLNAPFTINSKKTRYGSKEGRNWNLGIMVNGNNEMTVGHQAKRNFKNTLGAYCCTKSKGGVWSLEDLQTLEGYRNYYRMIERTAIDKIVADVSAKFGIDVIKSIKEDIRSHCNVKQG